jgi:hypothetical protein
MLFALIFFCAAVFVLLWLFKEVLIYIHCTWGIRNYILDHLYYLYTLIIKIFNL